MRPPRTRQGVTKITPTRPKFSSLSDATGLDVVDPIETRHFSLLTDEPVAPTDADPGRFPFPVSTAYRIRCSTISLPYVMPIGVRVPDGEHLTSINLPATEEFPQGDT